MPAMILGDGMLGQMMEPVEVRERKVDKTPKPWAATGHEGKRKPNIINSLYISPDELEQKVVERYQRYAAIQASEQRAETYLTEDAETVIVAFGACSRVARSAVDAARAEGIKVGLVRPITLWPFPTDILSKTAETAKDFLCVEMNMGQMVDDVRLAIECRRPVHFFGRTGGIIPTPAEVLSQIKTIAGGAK